MSTNTGSLALQLINGIIAATMTLSRNVCSVRRVIMAGTLHPNPISSDTEAFPLTPTLRKYRSRINAMRERYPLCSKTLRHKKSMRMFGKNTERAPIPQTNHSTKSEAKNPSPIVLFKTS